MEAVIPNQPALKHCPYCGMDYRPYVRAVETQKSCGKAACRKQSKREAHKAWLKDNPDCYRGRYVNVKIWLAEHPGYLQQYRVAHPGYVSQDNAGRRLRKQKMKRFRADIQDGLLRRGIARIQTLKGADIQETLNLKVDGIIAMLSG